MAEQGDLPGHALPTDKAVVVIGAGTMGSGIAEVAACAGHRVYLRDASATALDRGMAQIRRSLDKRVERGRLDASQRDAIIARLQPVNADAKLSDVGLVIEVIVENLDVKVAVLSQIESEVEPDTIIATNTSSLSVTAIAGRLARPDRVVGMHFFNPATLLPLVEVVGGAATAPDVTQTIFETAKAWGKVPVVCRSTPRLHRQSRGAALLRRSAAPAAGAGRHSGDAGCRDARVRWIQDGPVRADGPDRARRELRRHEVGVRGVLRRPALQAFADPEGSGRCWLARPQERARLL